MTGDIPRNQVADTTRYCLQLLQDGNSRLKDVEDIDEQWCDTQAMRMRSWCASLGVFATGHASLQHRLRYVPEIEASILQLLEAIKWNLAKASELASAHSTSELNIELRGPTPTYRILSQVSEETEERVPGQSYRTEIDSSSSDTSTAEPSDSASNSLHRGDEVQHCLEQAEESVTNLLELSRWIRRQSNRQNGTRSLNFVPRGDRDEDLAPEFESYARFMLNVQIKNKSLQSQLFEALVRSVVQRWRLLCYRRNHAQKLAQGLDLVAHDVASADVGIERNPSGASAPFDSSQTHPKPQHDTPHKLPNPANTVMSATSASVLLPTPLPQTLPPKSDGEAKSSMKARYFGLPARPKPRQDGYFDCPYCCIACPSTERLGYKWREHLMRDLAPYVCLNSDCENARLFRTSFEWTAHMRETHFPQIWTCPICPQPLETVPTLENFLGDEAAFLQHLHQKHEAQYSKSESKLVLRKCVQHQTKLFVECPFCDEFDAEFASSGKSPNQEQHELQRHIGGHMQSFALISLPFDIDQADSSTLKSDSIKANNPMVGKMLTIGDIDSATEPVDVFTGPKTSTTEKEDLESYNSTMEDLIIPLGSTFITEEQTRSEAEWTFLPRAFSDLKHDRFLAKLVAAEQHRKAKEAVPFAQGSGLVQYLMQRRRPVLAHFESRNTWPDTRWICVLCSNIKQLFTTLDGLKLHLKQAHQCREEQIAEVFSTSHSDYLSEYFGPFTPKEARENGYRSQDFGSSWFEVEDYVDSDDDDEYPFTILKNRILQTFVEIPITEHRDRIEFLEGNEEILDQAIEKDTKSILLRQAIEFSRMGKSIPSVSCILCLAMIRMGGDQFERRTTFEGLRDQNSDEKREYIREVKAIQDIVMRQAKEEGVMQPPPRRPERQVLGITEHSSTVYEQDERDDLSTMRISDLLNTRIRPEYTIQASDEPPTVDDNLSSKFKIHSNGREFFRPGRVFAVRWHEGNARNLATEALLQPRHSSRMRSRGPWGQVIYNHLRHMVVVKTRTNACWCVAIGTYGGIGLSKQALDLDEINAHTIIHDSTKSAVYLKGEARTNKRPIRVTLSAGASLDPASRIHLGKPYKVEFGLKVMKIGHVHPEDLDILISYVRMELGLDD